MRTSIDTNILVALWDADDLLNRAAKGALDAALARGGLVISGVVYAELLAAPRRTRAFIDRFCDEAGIEVEWEMNERIWRGAGEAFQGYAERRRKQKGTESRRILVDFLIGAHALVSGYKLLTLDERMYQASFPRLAIVSL